LSRIEETVVLVPPDACLAVAHSGSHALPDSPVPLFNSASDEQYRCATALWYLENSAMVEVRIQGCHRSVLTLRHRTHSGRAGSRSAGIGRVTASIGLKRAWTFACALSQADAQGFLRMPPRTLFMQRTNRFPGGAPPTQLHRLHADHHGPGCR
jgi:hypothetical protein